MNDITCEQLAEELYNEWEIIEDFRRDACKDLLLIAGQMHNMRKKLTEDMIEVLIESNWRQGEVTRHLAEGCASLLKAVKCIDSISPIMELALARYQEDLSDGIL